MIDLVVPATTEAPSSRGFSTRFLQFSSLVSCAWIPQPCCVWKSKSDGLFRTLLVVVTHDARRSAQNGLLNSTLHSPSPPRSSYSSSYPKRSLPLPHNKHFLAFYMASLQNTPGAGPAAAVPVGVYAHHVVGTANLQNTPSASLAAAVPVGVYAHHVVGTAEFLHVDLTSTGASSVRRCTVRRTPCISDVRATATGRRESSSSSATGSRRTVSMEFHTALPGARTGLCGSG